MSASLPEIASLSTLPTDAQHAVIDTLFEPSRHLHSFATTLFDQEQQRSQPTLSSYQDLISAVGAYLNGLSASNLSEDRGILFEILGSHPRLGEKSPTKLSEMSKKEQANLKTGEGGSAENDTDEQLRRLNGVYEERFPGLRYVVFVNGRGRDVILEDMRRRIDRGNIDMDIAETIKAMCDIATDRVRKLENQ